MEHPIRLLLKKTKLTHGALAKELGVGPASVARWLKTGTFPRYRSPARQLLEKMLDEHSVEWSGFVNDDYIKPSRVSRGRKKHPAFFTARERWTNVDWSRTNLDLSESLGVDIKHLRNMRKRYAPLKYQHTVAAPAREVVFSGKILREHRVRMGVTQQYVADRIGCKKADLIRQWEKGERTPSATYLLRMLIALRMPLDIFETDVKED